MLSSIISLEEIKICNTNINQIPSRAFRSINGIQKNLSTIEFYGSPIVKIGDYPFYSLNNLIHLEFSATSIKSIPKTVFHFRNDSNVTMTLNLYSNDLNGTSFAMGSLTNLKRPTIINFWNNKNLTFLNQTIFQPFLESNVGNKIWFQESNYFDCDDCRSFWLKKESKYSHKTDLTKCSNGKEFSDSTNFAKCNE